MFGIPAGAVVAINSAGEPVACHRLHISPPAHKPKVLPWTAIHAAYLRLCVKGHPHLADKGVVVGSIGSGAPSSHVARVLRRMLCEVRACRRAARMRARHTSQSSETPVQPNVRQNATHCFTKLARAAAEAAICATG